MSKYKIEHDIDACIGCGACISMCPDNWEMSNEGKAIPKKAELDEIGCNEEAKDSCPVDCIKIEETS
ncbi:MAG: ferredoxin [Candidatus Aenigmarchaeota archaeon]|nr:ferredoxin [Candidatus Aenigmarchaeota archaeon]MCK5177227.1 ferredoxin [Candidatus Aenigmarchaeota archaeon]